jgi:hypothetical protein
LDLAERIVTATTHASGVHTVEPVDLATETQNQLLFFFKPECFMSPDQAAQTSLVNMALERIEAFHARIQGVVVVDGTTLGAQSIMDRHYGFINELSRTASTAITDDARANLLAKVGASDQAAVRGGHEILAETQLNPQSLEDLWATKESVRVRSGFYAQRYDLDGREVVIVNGFHPAQLAHFTEPSRRVVLLLLVSDQPWPVLRGRLIGDTFPANAAPGSIRRTLADNPSPYGLDKVGVANNCCHLSAGPFEALFEIGNFLVPMVEGLRLGDARMASHLRAAGFSRDPASLGTAAEVSVGGATAGLFDATEDLDALSAAHLLAAGATGR